MKKDLAEKLQGFFYIRFGAQGSPKFIKKIQDSECYLVFLVRVARLVGSAHSLLRKHPIMFADREGVQVSLEEKTKQTA